MNAPYTDSKNYNPGPGTYGEKRTSFTYKPRKKLTTETIGFDSSDPRPCLKKQDPADQMVANVGAQKFEEGEMPNTISSRLNSKMNIGAVGSFGATDTRFRGGPFDATKAAQMPGPGAYDTRTKLADGVNKNGDVDNDQKMSELQFLSASKSTSAFRSNTVRFGTNGKGSSGLEQGPDAGAIFPSQWIKEPLGRSSVSQLSFARRMRLATSMSKNDITDWRRPGPGQYRTDRKISVSNVRRVQQHRRNPRVRPQLTQSYSSGSRRRVNKSKTNMTMSLSRRFGSGNKKYGDNLGPGTYTTTGSMIKKSYNVTMR